MVIIGIICIVFGATLSQFFRVFILAPICCASIISIILAGSLSGHNMGRMIVVAIASAIGLQIGYFAGCALRRAFSFLRAGANGSRQRQVFPFGSPR